MGDNGLNRHGSFRIDRFLVDPAALRVSSAGSQTRVEAKAMQVLLYLVRHRGQVISRAELEAELWPGRVVTEDAVTNAVAKLRRVFGDDARRPRVIETVPKSGYRLIAEPAPVGNPGREPPPASPVRPGRRRFSLALAAALLVALGWWWLGPSGSKPRFESADRPVLAILPFENLGPSPEQDYFANGMTADLITDLSKLSGLLVIAPGSVFAYRGGRDDARQVALDLGVDYVVAGSVQRSGDRLRINVRLLEARLERALWGQRYDATMEQVFAVQDQLAAALIAALEIELAPGERALLAQRPTNSVAAYDHYLRGLEDHGRRTREFNRSARQQFEQAIALDPGFARAYAGLAMVFSREAIDGWSDAPASSLRRAEELASTAATMEPALAQVHFVNGQVALFQRRHAAAIESAQRAIDSDPNYADAYALSAWVLNYAGRPTDALARLRRAMRLNPRPPASYLEILGEIQFTQADYDSSVASFRQVLAVNPEYARARMWLAAGLAQAGDLTDAEWEAAELLVANPRFGLQRMDFAFPFKNPQTRDRLLEGLRAAGLPD